MNPFNDITNDDRDTSDIGKTGPFDFFLRTSFSRLVARGDDDAYIKEHIQREVDFSIGKKLSAHLVAVTKGGKEIVTKIHWHDPVEQYDRGYMPYTLTVYRVTGYVLLTNPEEAEIGDYAQLERENGMVVGSPYEGMASRGMTWRVGRHIFEQIYIDSIRFYQCKKILSMRPYEGMGYNYQEPKEADVTWKDVTRAKLPPGQRTLPGGEMPLP